LEGDMDGAKVQKVHTFATKLAKYSVKQRETTVIGRNVPFALPLDLPLVHFDNPSTSSPWHYPFIIYLIPTQIIINIIIYNLYEFVQTFLKLVRPWIYRYHRKQ